MDIGDIEVNLIDGTATRFGDLASGVALVVNVASKCGLAPQYEGLEALHQEFGPSGLTVIGMPCNQFLNQEPGNAEQIGEFCKLNYGVTFPLLAKDRVNGRNAHPLYRELKQTKDSKGMAGPVLWNFEKFLVGRPVDAGAAAPRSVQRFRSVVTPEDAELRAAIEAALGEA